MIKDKKKEELGGIAHHLKRAHLSLLKVFWIAAAIFYGGVLRERYQKWFSDKLGWHEMSLTLLNAIIFGLGFPSFYFLWGRTALGFISGFVIEGLAGFFNFATHTLLFYYSFYSFSNAVFRIGYALKTKRAIASFNLVGAVMNSVHFIGGFFIGR